MKTAYSAWSKMRRQGVPLQALHDVLGLRIIFRPTAAGKLPTAHHWQRQTILCYRALEVRRASVGARAAHAFTPCIHTAYSHHAFTPYLHTISSHHVCTPRLYRLFTGCTRRCPAGASRITWPRRSQTDTSRCTPPSAWARCEPKCRCAMKGRGRGRSKSRQSMCFLRGVGWGTDTSRCTLPSAWARCARKCRCAREGEPGLAKVDGRVCSCGGG
jgi:hypothetical protein